MLIRSQDRKGIVIINNVEAINVNEYFVSTDSPRIWKIGYSGHKVSSFLGEYSTEEKAIKVIDMICDNYGSLNAVPNAVTFGASQVFEMPEDENVIIYN